MERITVNIVSTWEHFRLRGGMPKSYFTCDKFECPTVYKQKNKMEISFFY